jgi:cell division protein FtsW
MSRGSRKIDRFFLITTVLLTVFGFIIFLSASLGLLTQSSSSFASIALKQTISLGLGIVCFYVFSKMSYVWIRRWALFIFIGAIIINLLLFIPQLSIFHGGASRWIDLGFISFQPSELLKISFIIYLAAWIRFAKDKIVTFRFGLLPYLILVGVLGLLLMAQSDTDTLGIIALTGLIMIFIAGLPWKYVISIILIGIISLSAIIYYRPYVAKRISTYFDINKDASGAGYQINQSLIAIGSGELTGRGVGQSIQKFGYLPQPTDDSVFAVAAEEFGFIGTSILILLYLAFAISILRIGVRSEDIFASYFAIGIGILIVTQSFLNMSVMLNILPLSGLPLLFVSHGGTALIFTLSAAGIVANISKRIE